METPADVIGCWRKVKLLRLNASANEAMDLFVNFLPHNERDCREPIFFKLRKPSSPKAVQLKSKFRRLGSVEISLAQESLIALPFDSAMNDFKDFNFLRKVVEIACVPYG